MVQIEMKANLIHHSSEWIDGDFSPPNDLARKPHLVVWRQEVAQTGDYFIFKLNRGAGIWSASGELVFYQSSFADMTWLNSPTELLCVENTFAPHEEPSGVQHLMKRFKVGSYSTPENTLNIHVPTGGIEYLIVNHKEDRCLVSWLDQGSWGYIIVDIAAMKQLSGSFQWPSPTLSPPKFSPDDSVVVACNYYRAGWWTDNRDEYWDSPSEGGLRKVGTISVYNIMFESHTDHDVLVLLPEGWLPDDADNSDWDAIWGPEFIADNQFRIWLPDGSTRLFQLPLPDKIVIDDQFLRDTR